MGEPFGQCTRTSAGASARSRTSRVMPYTWNWMSAMGSSGDEVGLHTITAPARAPSAGRPGSSSDGSLPEPRQHGLVARSLDSLELGLHTVQRRRRLVVLVPGIGEVLADDVERAPELVDVAAEPREAPLDLLRVLLDLQPAQPEHDHLQIRVEAV